MKNDQKQLVETLSRIYRHNPVKLASIAEDLFLAGEIDESAMQQLSLPGQPNKEIYRARLVEGCGSDVGCGSSSSSSSDGCGASSGCDSPPAKKKKSSAGDGCGSTGCSAPVRKKSSGGGCGGGASHC